jgi:hypothetical protein
MNDLKFVILENLYNSQLREMYQADIFNIDKNLINDIKQNLNDLIDVGYVKRLPGSNKYQLTSPGVAAYEQLKQERYQYTEQKRQQRFDNKISVASVLIPLVTFFLGLLFEHFTNFVALLISIFS